MKEIQDTNTVFRNIASYVSERIDLRYNTVRLVTEYRKRGENEYKIFTDRERTSLLIDMLESRPFKFSKADYDLYMSSNRVAEFDPYLDYFENLPVWDGEDRIKQLTDYVKVEDTPQYNFVWQIKKWLVRVVKCALEPIFFNKQILLFVGGEQNTGKTTFCRWLCPPELSDYWSEESPSGKDESIQLASNFYILYDELVKLSKASEAEIKTTLSKTIIKYRPPYARAEQNFTRRCSFMGTSNPTEFLTDPTNFWQQQKNKKTYWRNYKAEKKNEIIHAAAKSAITNKFLSTGGDYAATMAAAKMPYSDTNSLWSDTFAIIAAGVKFDPKNFDNRSNLTVSEASAIFWNNSGYGFQWMSDWVGHMQNELEEMWKKMSFTEKVKYSSKYKLYLAAFVAACFVVWKIA